MSSAEDADRVVSSRECIALTLVAFAYGILFALGRGFEPGDEAWFLQVVERVGAGEVLYRDVFYGATPLAVDVSELVTSTFGRSVIVLKLVFVVCMTAIAVLAAEITRRLGIGRAGAVLVINTILAGTYSMAASGGSLYSPLAAMFALLAFMFVLPRHGSEAASRRDRLLRASLSATAAGCAFATKQNIGLLALVAVCACVALARPRRLVGELAAVLGVFSVTSLLLMLRSLVAGGGSKLLEYGFTAKGTYIARAGVPYTDALDTLFSALQDAGSLAGWKVFLSHQPFLLPLLATLLLTAVWSVGRQERPTTSVVALFVVAALLGAMPRFDGTHMAAAVPMVSIAAAYALDRLGRRPSSRVPQLMTLAAATWTALAVLGVGVWSVYRMSSSQYVRTTLPHFESELLRRDKAAHLAASVGALRSIVPAGSSPFLLSGTAGFHYLATELENPTPFDYPYVTALGIEGEDGVAREIERGRIRMVAIDLSSVERNGGALWPRRLEQYVRTHMNLVARRGPWELYATETRQVRPASAR